MEHEHYISPFRLMERLYSNIKQSDQRSFTHDYYKNAGIDIRKYPDIVAQDSIAINPLTHEGVVKAFCMVKMYPNDIPVITVVYDTGRVTQSRYITPGDTSTIYVTCGVLNALLIYEKTGAVVYGTIRYLGYYKTLGLVRTEYPACNLKAVLLTSNDSSNRMIKYTQRIGCEIMFLNRMGMDTIPGTQVPIHFV